MGIWTHSKHTPLDLAQLRIFPFQSFSAFKPEVRRWGGLDWGVIGPGEVLVDIPDSRGRILLFM